jgi:hypothetical protein
MDRAVFPRPGDCGLSGDCDGGAGVSFGLGALFWLFMALGYYFAGMTVQPFAMKMGSFASLVVLVVPYLLGAGWARRRQRVRTTI